MRVENSLEEQILTFRCPLTFKRKKAFTLVELLITMIIIGILASALLLVAGGAEERAMASRILEDARTMKSAALFYNSDHDSWPIWVLSGPNYMNMVPGLSDALPSKYVGQIPVRDQYWFGVVNDSTVSSGDVKAAVVLYDSGLSSGVRRRMGLMAEEMGIYAMDDPAARDFSLVHTYTSSDSNMMWFITARP